jgi:hypothetical protein
VSIQAVEMELGTGSAESRASGVSWAAIAAGAVTTSALTLVLLAFGAGMEFLGSSPWNAGASATKFGVAAGIYLLVLATLSSSVGGYIAGRLRTKWVDLHSHEVYFRDTAHGFLSWAFASVISAALLASVTTSIASGAASGAAQAGGAAMSDGGRGNSSSYFVDSLLRSPTSPAAGDTRPMRDEVSRILAASAGGDMPAADRTYLTQLVAARTGLSPADAEKRVSDVTAEAKAAADRARKAAGAMSLWLAASMLLGAFAASLAATEGGELRDRDQSVV